MKEKKEAVLVTVCDACFATVQLKIEAGLKGWKDGFKACCYPGVTLAIRIPCLPHLPYCDRFLANGISIVGDTPPRVH
jgi:hypothetical protein